MPRERDGQGQFKETVSVEDVLHVFKQVSGPVITSRDVADQYECSTESARQKLQQTYDQGDVERRKIAGTTVYWVTTDEASHSEKQ